MGCNVNEVDVKAVKLEPTLLGRCHQFDDRLYNVINDQRHTAVDDSTICSTSSIEPAPISRQFWIAGNYDETHSFKSSKSTCGTVSNYLHVHPKFLHSNATSHKWAFGAIAELVDNAVDEIQNGATCVNVEKILNPRDGTAALLLQDDGGGMSPKAMRCCLSFGFSDKKEKASIGQYGNGFKTSSMRLGSDVIVMSRNCKERQSTQSIGLLSYTFLRQTHQDRIVVPIIDYKFNLQSGTWHSLHNEQHHKNNLSILLRWSPFATEDELLNQCDMIDSHGTRIIIYNLWDDDEGKMELNFESDPKDICLSVKENKTEKLNFRQASTEQHLATRLRYSLRAYLSILYLRVPQNFCIKLCGQVVVYHSIANDLKFPEFILYKPKNVESQVVTTIGFLKEVPNVNIHGFNVYHKNRLILPFWHVVAYSDNRGRGVVGVLEADFIQPTHNKQEFERTPVFQKLETRLKEMTLEYWDHHCSLIIGYQAKKLQTSGSQFSSHSKQDLGIFRPVRLSSSSSKVNCTNLSGASLNETNASLNHKVSNQGQGASLKRKGRDCEVLPKMEHISAMKVPKTTTVQSQDVQPSIAPGNQLGDHENADVIRKNQKLTAQCQEHERREKELKFKIERLRAEIQEARREHAKLLLESKLLDRINKQHRQVT